MANSSEGWMEQNGTLSGPSDSSSLSYRKKETGPLGPFFVYLAGSLCYTIKSSTAPVRRQAVIFCKYGGSCLNTIPECIFHSRKIECKSPYGAVPAGQTVTFSTYPKREHGTEHITLWIEEDGGTPVAYPMRWYGLAGARDRYSTTFTPDHPGLYWYYFTFDTADGPRFCARGYGGRGEIIDTLGDKYQLTVYDPAYHPPRWFGEGISYNIFPDRFCRDKMPVQPQGEGAAPRVLHENWDDLPVYQPDENGEILNNDFFGGTLRGVIQKLDYLESLRVTTIYFNPIFQAYSNHRYDTGDYKRIDPMLGTEEDFRALCREAAARGMRVVLDGVFNHTGFDSRYFNGRGRYDSVGAHQSKDSPYYRWFDFQQWPDRYGSWWGIYTLPQVRETDETYQDYIFRDADSVVRRWLRLGASGWRLDVADELPDDFIRSLNAAAKEEKPDAHLFSGRRAGFRDELPAAGRDHRLFEWRHG